ncbi:mitogen-activated protein kinase kinase kinase 18-like [Cynara cardunculus var. scolymus]|uniref:Protein kinase, ATP binding site-containing protein n=1 Tax=Cynara cardunculus var. scolymus TaxID=59895 RepID=A0A103Y3U0_CYNCS|nr:mitogen-activated protein kinase kinase kinase 18-like [Cynara cardunculus var. scolymus]KVI02030.1 Protein kinase, ATP binding site-containing protein [Cynara cardunculus var. scolymus]
MGWTRGGVLGRGSSATVSTATSTTGEVFAVKSAALSQSETLQREQQFLSILRSPYVVSYKGCEITKEDNRLMYNLLMKYMPEGTIVDAIGRRKRGRLSESEISNYMGQILRGLEYIHSNGIVHCDIKGANLLVGKGGGVKIADLGCAKWVGEDVAVRGTPMFMAPEVARGEEQGFAADIWAVGCVVIEMATGGSPWTNVDDPVSVLYKIAFSGESPEIPSGFSRQANDFIRKCLIQDPKERWGATELLKHPFLRRFNRKTQQIVDQDFSKGSPTSVLDQDVWSSMEVSASVGIDSYQPPCSSNSLRQRIKQLAGNPHKEQPNCEEEINWMMIRSNQNSWELEG